MEKFPMLTSRHTHYQPYRVHTFCICNIIMLSWCWRSTYFTAAKIMWMTESKKVLGFWLKKFIYMSFVGAKILGLRFAKRLINFVNARRLYSRQTLVFIGFSSPTFKFILASTLASSQSPISNSTGSQLDPQVHNSIHRFTTRAKNHQKSYKARAMLVQQGVLPCATCSPDILCFMLLLGSTWRLTWLQGQSSPIQ